MRSTEALHRVSNIIEEALDYIGEAGGPPGTDPIISGTLTLDLVRLLEDAFIASDLIQRIQFLRRAHEPLSVVYDYTIGQETRAAALIREARARLMEATRIAGIGNRNRYPAGASLWIVSYLTRNSYVNQLHDAFRERRDLGRRSELVSGTNQQVSAFLNRALANGGLNRQERGRVENAQRRVELAARTPSREFIQLALTTLHDALAYGTIHPTWHS